MNKKSNHNYLLYLLIIFSILLTASNAYSLAIDVNVDKTEGLLPLEINFTIQGTLDQKNNPEDYIVGYSVDYQDADEKDDEGFFTNEERINTNETTVTFTHTYTKSGSFKATCTVYDSTGETAKFMFPIKISARSVEITSNVTSGLAPFEVSFTCIAGDTNAPIDSYIMDFGDIGRQIINTDSNSVSFNHTYITGGTYAAKCVVVDADGNRDQSNAIVIQVGLKKFSFASDIVQGMAPLEVEFTATYIRADKLDAKYTLEYGDGIKETVESAAENVIVKHTYEKSGIYEVVCKIHDGRFRDSTEPMKIVVGKWKTKTNDEVVSTPAYDPLHDTVYVGSNDGNLYAINENDGMIKWTFNTNRRLMSSPAVGSDGTIYIGSEDSNLYAINPDGTQKWAFPTTLGKEIYSSPIIGPNGTVYIGSTDNFFYAVNPDGTEKWRFDTGYKVMSSPAIAYNIVNQEYVIYLGSLDGILYTLSLNGDIRWTFDTKGDEIYSSPAVGPDGSVYIASCKFSTGEIEHQNKIHALTMTGVKKWDRPFATDKGTYSSPVLDADGSIFLGAYDNFIYGLSPGGSLKWNYKTGLDVTASGTADFNGTFYIGSEDGILYAIDLDGELLWQFKTGNELSPQSRIQSSVALSPDGKAIYFGSGDYFVYAIDNIDPEATTPESSWPMFLGRYDHRAVGPTELLPAVTHSEPYNDQKGVPVDQLIKVYFSKPMDPEELYAIRIFKDSSLDDESLNISLDPTGKIATLTIPSQPILDFNTEYNLVFLQNSKDLDKNKLHTSWLWNFTTMNEKGEIEEDITEEEKSSKSSSCFINTVLTQIDGMHLFNKLKELFNNI